MSRIWRFGLDDACVGVISASDVSWIEPFTGVSPRAFSRFVAQLRRARVDRPGPGRPWKLGLPDGVLLVAAYWRTNLTLRQLAPLFGVPRIHRFPSLKWEPGAGPRRNVNIQRPAVGHYVHPNGYREQWEVMWRAEVALISAALNEGP